MTTIPGRGGPALRSALPQGSSGRTPHPSSWRTGTALWALAASGAILAIDSNIPLGTAVGALYAIPVLIASLSAHRGVVLAIAILCSILVVAGWLISPSAETPGYVGVNRALSVLGVWVPAIVALQLVAVRSSSARTVELEHTVAAELHESMRLGLNRLLTLSDQIARSGASATEAAQRIRSRAQVMLTVLGVLSRARGEPVSLETLIRTMLPGSSADVLRMSGPPVMVPARQTQAVILLLHELLSNSRAHGALSSGDGSITVRWTVDPIEGGRARRVTLWWEESGGRPIESAPSPGFGTALISSAVVHDLSGTVDLSYPAEGCRHQFQFIVDEATPPPTR